MTIKSLLTQKYFDVAGVASLAAVIVYHLAIRLLVCLLSYKKRKLVNVIKVFLS